MVSLTFPAPSTPLSYNAAASLHWSARRRKLAPWRAAIARAWRYGPLDPFTSCQRITVTLPFARKARRDPANYVAPLVKALVDELTCPAPKKGVPSCRSVWPVCGHAFPDDTPDYVTVAEPVFHYGTDEVRVTFEAV